MFNKKSHTGYSDPLPGIKMKTIAHGDKTLMAEFILSKGSVLPGHSHVHEQTGYLVYGHISLTIGAETYDAMPGDCWCVPSGVEHKAVAHEDSCAVEVFSPVREDYLP